MAHSSSIRSILVGESRQQELGVAGDIALIGRKQGEMNTCNPQAFSMQSKTQASPGPGPLI